MNDQQHDVDIDHSRPLDVHKWSDYPEVNRWVYSFWDEHLSTHFSGQQRGPKPKQDPKYQFKVLLLDVYVAWREDPTLLVGVSKSKSGYKAGSRYNALHISSLLIKLIDALVAKGYLEQKLGTEGAEGAGRVTRIWPTAALISYFETAEFSDFDISRKDQECIVLNDTKDEDGAKPLEYDDDDHPVIKPARAVLQAYNDLISTLHIDIPSLETPEVQTSCWNKKAKRWRIVPVRQTNKFVRRIFYRSDWNVGGRFHGGWWQQVPSDYRQHIYIDGQATIEVDYSSLHIALAYALEGYQPPEAPYEIELKDTGIPKHLQRGFVKQLVLTAINAKDRPSTYQAFRNEVNTEHRKSQLPKLTNEVLEAVLDTFIEANRQIESYIASDKGVELMAVDGRVTNSLIKKFTELKKPILTVHDSYIVLFEDERLLRQLMATVLQEETDNYSFKMKAESLSPMWAEAMRDPMDPSRRYDAYNALGNKTKITEQYRQRLEHFKNWRSSLLRGDSKD